MQMEGGMWSLHYPPKNIETSKINTINDVTITLRSSKVNVLFYNLRFWRFIASRSLIHCLHLES